MNDKRRFLAASLLGGALGPTAFAADPPARPKAEGGGPGENVADALEAPSLASSAAATAGRSTRPSIS